MNKKIKQNIIVNKYRLYIVFFDHLIRDTTYLLLITFSSLPGTFPINLFNAPKLLQFGV